VPDDNNSAEIRRIEIANLTKTSNNQTPQNRPYMNSFEPSWN